MRRPRNLQERVHAAILEAAAHVFARRGSGASMSAVASAAGIARATLYRYFPNREALQQELIRSAVAEAARRLKAARLDEVEVPEGIARAVRALVTIGDGYVILAREQPRPRQFERSIGSPLRALFERGQVAEDIRNDIPASWLAEALLGLVVGALLSSDRLGTEDSVAVISTLFLDGSRSLQAGLTGPSPQRSYSSSSVTRPRS
jgi:AcrR family transcriptional regulator